MALSDLRAVNEVETRYSLLIKNQAYVGIEVLPPFESNTGPGLTGTFWKYDPRIFQKTGDIKRAEDGTAYETRLVPTTDTFTTSEKAKRTPLRDITEKYADASVRPSSTATLLVVNELMLGHEKEVADKLTVTATYATGNHTTLSGTSQLSDFTNSDPLDVFADARLALKYVPYATTPNSQIVAVMSPEVWEILRQHPDLRGSFANSDGLLGLDQMAEVMGVNRILIGAAYKDTADDAAASATEARVWGKHIVYAFVNPSKAEQTMSFGYTVFSRMPDTAGIAGGDMAMGTPIRVRDYREEKRGGGTTWREADAAWDLKIVMNTMGYLIKDAIA